MALKFVHNNIYDTEGRRYGVYLEKRKNHWFYKINGDFQEIVGSIKLDICCHQKDLIQNRSLNYPFELDGRIAA